MNIWAMLASAVAAVAAALCIAVSVMALDGPLLAAVAAGGFGIVATLLSSMLSSHLATRRLDKLSEEMTHQARRLLRLENRALDPTPAAASSSVDLAAIRRAMGALGDALDAQDARIRAVEERPVPRDASEPAFEQAVAVEPNELNSREDFARAAATILNRLGGQPLGVVQSPQDNAVVASVEAGQIELWLQPIVTLPQRRTRLYAGLPHLPGVGDGSLGPDVIRPILQRRNRLDRLDAFALSQALLVANQLSLSSDGKGLKIALSRASLGNQAFVDGAAARLSSQAAAAQRLVIELDGRDILTLAPHEAKALVHLRSLGAQLAAQVRDDLQQDWPLLARAGVVYASVPADLILGTRPHDATETLVAEIARAGIVLVAEGIEDERRVPDLLDFEVPCASGEAIAPARPEKAVVMAPTRPKIAPAAPAPPPEPDEPASFRDFLRRAG